MPGRPYLLAPGKLLVLFLLLAGIPFAGLGWLGWRWLDQDRRLERQRLHDRLEDTAGLLIQELDRGLSAWETFDPAAVPPGGVLLFFDGSGVLRTQGVRLPYYPLAPASKEVSVSVFAAAESEEFQRGDLIQAAVAYGSLAATPDRAQRAGALMRLARCLRKEQKTGEAIGVYAKLAALGETPVAGSPAELLARSQREALFQALGNEKARRQEMDLLASALFGGRYGIDHATFDLYAASVAGAAIPAAAAPARELAEAVEAMWPEWQQQASGRATWRGESHAWAAVWRRGANGTAAQVGSVDWVAAATESTRTGREVGLMLVDPRGRWIWGALPGGAATVGKTFRETGLPWTVEVASLDPAAGETGASSRRLLLIGGFALTLLVIATAGYAVFRAVGRELRVARMQSDFVAAVSHEFRSPLTAMCHLTELLQDGGAERERLPLYYSALAKETRRLHRLVESLLDLARMEAGRRVYEMERLDARDLARDVVGQFQIQAAANSHRVELDSCDGACLIRADREGITRALWNLLDNAVKYSPPQSTVRVCVDQRDDRVRIAVEDQGAGIPHSEQREVFRKFVRGAFAKAQNIKGTGLGLAMVERIVKAHRGRVSLESEAGHGSRFSIVLPKESDGE